MDECIIDGYVIDGEYVDFDFLVDFNSAVISIKATTLKDEIYNHLINKGVLGDSVAISITDGNKNHCFRAVITYSGTLEGVLVFLLQSSSEIITTFNGTVTNEQTNTKD